MTLLSQVEIKLEDVEVLHLFILHLAGYDEYVKRTNEMFTLVNIERYLNEANLTMCQKYYLNLFQNLRKEEIPNQSSE
jgi:hypothetical protein